MADQITTFEDADKRIKAIEANISPMKLCTQLCYVINKSIPMYFPDIQKVMDDVREMKNNGGGGGGLNMREFDDMNSSMKNDGVMSMVKNIKSEVDYMRLSFTSDKLLEINRTTEAVKNLK